MRSIENKSKYIKNDLYKSKIKLLSLIFLFTYYVMPQYFGIPTPGFDMTAQRIMVILIACIIMSDKKNVIEFYNMIKNELVTKYIVLFLLIAMYTAGLNGHIGTFLNPFLEFFAMFELVYVIKKYIGIDETICTITKLLYLLCILGIIESCIGESLFSYLETIDGLYTGVFIRSGSYRIMGPANHSLGYGLILLVSFPLACYNVEKKEINIFNNFILFLLVTINVFLTGSRSTLGIFFVEIILLFIFSKSINKKVFIIIFSVVALCLCIAVIATYGSSFSDYVLLQITSIIDQIMGTELAVKYGAEISRLQDSSEYRALLPKVYTVDWLNPFLGKGTGYKFTWFYEGTAIYSIDNYYIVLYISYAYPGMIAYVICILYFIISILKKAINEKNQLLLVLFIASACYYINLYWVATLQTLKYVYIVFAIFIVLRQKNQGEVSNDISDYTNI